MELLLELRYHADRSTSGVDVRVDVDAADTVAALTEALSDYARRHGGRSGPDGVGLIRSGRDDVLDPADLVVETGLVSGETVMLAESQGAAPFGADERTAPRRPRPAAGAPPNPSSQLPADPVTAPSRRDGQAQPGDLRATGGLTLDVTAGPGVGRVVPLRRDLTVGRADTCTVVVDDPTMSREHFALKVAPDRRVVVVPNPEATNGTVVAGVELQEPRDLELGDVIEAGASSFAVRSGVVDETRRRDRLGQVPLNRVPYRRTVVWPRQLDDVAAPPETPTAGRLSLATALMPLASAGAMAFMFRNYLFMGIAALSPIMLVFRHVGTKRGGKRRYRRDKAAYEQRLDAAVVALDAALDDERRIRLTAAPDLAELARQAMLHMPRLWERDRVAGDLLDLRLGLGEIESQVSSVIAPGGDGDLRAAGAARLAHQASVVDAPITVNLLDVGIAGLWGDPAQVASAGRALVAQAACLHSPEDLVVAAAMGNGSLAGFEWLKWLPHVRSSTSPVEGAHLAVGPDPTRALLARLLAVAADRAERGRQAGAELWPRVLLAVEEAAEPDRALLSQLLDVAPAHGIHVVWLGESELQVPRQCRCTVSCPGQGGDGQVRFTDPAKADRRVGLDGADPETARSIARTLAPLRDASASSHTTAIPRVVSLFEAIGIGSGSGGDHAAAPASDGAPAPAAPAPPASIAERWRAQRGYGLELQLGVSADGPFGLDLVEHGPHTLIGGTSGSGKSELLQSLVLSLAASYSPTQLNFLFVDYKGGASSAEFRDLPHTVGYVTNLSGRMSLRALTSLRAELQRRMLLMEGKAKDLREMLQVAPAEAPPSLVIVVDEFAALVKEIPDFVAGMVDIAQRGRSLGVHLVLATQRPTGVVNDDILANTNLRISLRVLDPADSNRIVGSRDAADIPVPLRGRAYARTGPQALTPFQCAWSGAPFAPDLERASTVAVRPFDLVPRDEATSASASSSPGEAGSDQADVDHAVPTQLQVLVDRCADAARAMGLPPARRPWLEPLPEVLPLDRVLRRARPGELDRDPGRVAPVGLSDDPQNQAQHVAAVDLEATGGLVAFGTGGTGKTTLLRTLAVALARQGSVDDLRIYALDFASRALDPLADLPHCSAVVAGDEVERTARLLTLLDQEIDRRRQVLADARAETLGALRAQGGRPHLPRIVVLLDGYSGFHTTFDRSDRFRWLTRFQRIVSAGRQVGIHCVLTNDRRTGVPPVLLSAIGARLTLRMATPEELAALGVPSKVAKDAELPAGRGFLDGSTEVQVACVAGDPSALAQSEAIAKAAAGLAATEAGRAPALPELPAAVATDQLGVPRPPPPLTAPLGLVDLTHETAVADLSRQNLVVLGPPLSGRSTAAATVARGLGLSSGSGVQLCAIGSPASPLRGLSVWDDAGFTAAAHLGVAERLAEVLVGDDGLQVRAVLFVDAAEDVEGSALVKALEALAKHSGVRFVVAGEAATFAKAYSGWLAPLRRNRGLVVLQPESRSDVETVAGIKPDLRPDQEFPPGRAIFVAQRRWQLVQVAQADQRPPTHLPTTEATP
jgi:DNA segregation ATPase FtsK/SpoIIIE, S-DNA-T family